MYEKNTLRKIFNSNKLLIIIIAFFILCGYLIYANFLSKKFISDNFSSINYSDFNTKELPNQKSDIDSKNTALQSRSFNTSELVNDNRGVPVLYYHSVKESADNEVTITPKMLKQQLEYIKDQGYTTITMNELKDYLLNNSPIPKKSMIITFDDGYMDNYNYAFPILKDLNMVATIFCITSNLDGSYYLSKDAIKEMSDYGIDIESHTVTHPKLDALSYEDQLTELRNSKKTLEEITGKEVNSIAYPFGNFNDDTIKASKNAGYILGFTTKRGFSDRNDNKLRLDRIYISSKYNMDTFKEIINKTEK
ncbi:polysaccharide deacetylase family protein [Clostridium chromiireducens]|uniref:Poly-beta-1,6-N-acetyl-D-glucosamine N-deacetylase n=1 Tax=Clostridium chromiireducens TaxID=225345 RepID=A0A1V4I4V8_9CLOT|nr:polysaccharide deacetylase family protein [Clostridium chromiireducens]OPJ54625.1 poly-beta-1,6-N-acetyl-D-glucosamine N-deacetylase precursor [Clostridium chromiireducens]